MNITSYKYQDKGQWYLVSDDDFKKINNGEGQPAYFGRALYPVYSAPTEKEIEKGKTRMPLVVIRDGVTPTTSWYWQIREHTKRHNTCVPIGDGLCGFKMVRYIDWNANEKAWEIEPMVNHATPEQEKVLDNH